LTVDFFVEVFFTATFFVEGVSLAGFFVSFFATVLAQNLGLGPLAIIATHSSIVKSLASLPPLAIL